MEKTYTQKDCLTYILCMHCKDLKCTIGSYAMSLKEIYKCTLQEVYEWLTLQEMYKWHCRKYMSDLHCRKCTNDISGSVRVTYTAGSVWSWAPVSSLRWCRSLRHWCSGSLPNVSQTRPVAPTLHPLWEQTELMGPYITDIICAWNITLIALFT